MTRRDTTIDLHHLGRARSVACRLIDTTEGPVLVDPGPGATLGALTAGLDALGIALTDLAAVLLTHIHFDHAGVTGTLVARHPALRVYVHERGARHLADPSRLLASATRIYGDRMDTLWGAILPVPADRLHALVGGETLVLGERRVAVRYTPGHAVHHVTFLDESDGTAYVGDTAGVRLPPAHVVLPVTPPPDVDREQWLASLDAIAALAPTRLFLTHFAASDDPTTHLAELREGLQAWATQAHRLLEVDETDAVRADHFHAWVLASIADRLTPDQRRAVAEFSDFRASFHGLARYWRTRSDA
ncbi:MAG: MBL fold metallo-hydrolase [Gemmatimonadaceae bacterium]